MLRARVYGWLSCWDRQVLSYLLRNVLVVHLLTMPPVVDSYCDARGCFAAFFLSLILILVNLIIFDF